MTLYEIIHRSAGTACGLQDPSTGALPAGHNGPYRDPERAPRTTSHWLLTFLKAFEISGEQRFRTAAELCVRYLGSADARPAGRTFWHREQKDKDGCNGLIGQAWTVEALAAAATALGRPELLSTCEEVFLLHPFDERLGVWQRVEVDGTILPFDMTFNHQLWFAAAGGILADQAGPEVRRQVVRFLDRLPANLNTYLTGLIWHPLAIKEGPMDSAREFIRRVREQVRRGGGAVRKAIGYHAFNLYGLALLKQRFPAHPFWRSSRMRRIWRYACSPAYRSALDGNPFGYPYNPPGFEMAFALAAFGSGDVRAAQTEWVSEQLRRCLDRETGLMSLGTADPVTHAARLYEATRLPDLSVDAG